MQKLNYKLKALSPVLISTNVGDINTVSTTDFINGSSLLGIFAHDYIKRNDSGTTAHEDDRFYRWFLKGDLKFTNAYITDSERPGKKFFPAPLSIHEEKNGTAIFNKLFSEPPVQTKGISGFVSIENNSLNTCKVKKSLNFHHARDEETGTSKEGQIFNYESIDEAQVFEGAILGDEATLKEFLNTFGKEKIVYIGRSKNAQYGKVKIELDTKLEAFTSEIPVADAEEELVSLTLLSDTIIYNENGFSTTDITSLKKYLGLEIEKSIIKTGETENFISVWHLRKPSEVSFLAGSSFLVKVTQNDRNKLLKLEQEGIGERRNEGFGRIIFNWQKKCELVKKEDIKPLAVKPDFCPPTLTDNLIHHILTDFIEKKIKLTALEDAEEFKRLPPKAIIGRVESIAKTTDRNEFIGKLEKLRKTATDKLNRCRNKKNTLLDFIKKYEVNVGKIMEEHSNIKDLASIINFEPQNNNEFTGKLYKLYFKNFFALLRKKAKKEKGEG